MSHEYRIIWRDIASPHKPLYGVYQVFTDEAGRLTHWTDAAFSLLGSSIGDLITTLAYFQSLVYEAGIPILLESELVDAGVPLVKLQ